MNVVERRFEFYFFPNRFKAFRVVCIQTIFELIIMLFTIYHEAFIVEAEFALRSSSFIFPRMS